MVSARRKALLFSVVLIATSALFLMSAAASTEGFLRPLRQAGTEFPHDRPLSRHLAALGVGVGGVLDGDVARASGALVAVSRDGVVVESKSTDEKGHALFHLRPGAYRVDVTWGDLAANQTLRLHADTRLNLLFDDEGTPHWGALPQRSAERRGDAATLLVHARRVETNGSSSAAEGVSVEVSRPGGDGRVVANGSTGPRGAVVFDLHRGVYELTIRDGEAEASRVLQLCGATRVAVVFLADGNVTVDPDSTCHKRAHDEAPRKGPGREDDRDDRPARGGRRG